LEQTTMPETTGIRNPKQSDQWLVWPWPEGAGIANLVSHFIRAWPGPADDTVHQTAFYVGLMTALDTSIAARLHAAVDQRWLAEFRTAVSACAATYEAKLVAETPSCNSKVRPRSVATHGPHIPSRRQN
jgi:hypothetical protein